MKAHPIFMPCQEPVLLGRLRVNDTAPHLRRAVSHHRPARPLSLAQRQHHAKSHSVDASC